MAESCQESFTPIADIAIPKLMNLLYVTIAAINQPANDAIIRILLVTPITIIPAIVSAGVSSKHVVLRRRCIEYAGLLLKNQFSYIDQFRTDFETLLLSAVCDASSPVREGTIRISKLLLIFQERGWSFGFSMTCGREMQQIFCPNSMIE